jgi:hypothetical protein
MRHHNSCHPIDDNGQSIVGGKNEDCHLIDDKRVGALAEIGRFDRFDKLTAGRLTTGEPPQRRHRENLFMNIIETLNLSRRDGPIVS